MSRRGNVLLPVYFSIGRRAAGPTGRCRNYFLKNAVPAKSAMTSAP